METKGLEGGVPPGPVGARHDAHVLRRQHGRPQRPHRRTADPGQISGLSEKEAGPRSAHGDEDRGMKGTPIALPRGAQGNALKRLVSQTPRAAAKEQLLEAKVEMRASLRSGESKLRSEAEDRKGKIQRIAAVSRSARTLLTDGTDCWLIDDQTD